MLFLLFFLAVFAILWLVTWAVMPFVWRMISRAAGAIARTSLRSDRVKRIATRAERFRDYLPVLAIVAAGIIVTVFVSDAFLDLAQLVHANSPKVQTLDANIHLWAVQHRESAATPFFVAVTLIGGPAGIATLFVIVAIALAVRRHWSWLAYLAVTAGGGGLLNLELKQYFARSRPDVAEMMRRAAGYSFPSGHAMGSMVFFGALSYLGFRTLPRWRWKAAAIAFSTTIVLAVALSRVYLGVHWLTDVTAGVIIGTAWVTVCTIVYEATRRIRMLRNQRRRSSIRVGAAGLGT